jgi:hypothetical protein
MGGEAVLDMTWNEVSSALDYIAKYELTERHCKKNPLLSWIWRGADNLADDLKRVTGEIKRGAGNTL